MRLEEALRKAIRQFGVNVLSEKRLIFILADLRAYEEYPAVKPVLEAIVGGGAGKELCRLFLDDDHEGCLSYARGLGKSLSEESHFRRDLAFYAVDSMLFALGLTKTVTEPSDHGFDPLERGSCAGRAGAGLQKATGWEKGKVRTEGIAGVAGEAAGESVGGMPGQKAKETQSRSPEAPGGSGDAPRSASGRRSSKAMKWAAAALLLAGGFALGLIAAGSSHDNGQSAASRTAESSEAVKDAGHAPGAHVNGKNSQDASGDGEALGASDGSAAESHDGEYEYKEGEKHYYLGDARSYAEALQWYLKAAEKGHSGAEYSIGWMYEQGNGVRRDYQKAIGWYRKAAAHGSEIARKGIDRVGKLISVQGGDHDAWEAEGASDASDEVSSAGEYEYAEGEKCYYRLDYAGALQWYLKAAEKGHSGAEYSVGWLYEQGGNGVARDYQKSMDWYRRAAAHGSRAAQLRLRTDSPSR